MMRAEGHRRLQEWDLPHWTGRCGKPTSYPLLVGASGSRIVIFECRHVGVSLCALLVMYKAACSTIAPPSQQVEQALAKAGDNGVELAGLRKSVPVEQRTSVDFLLVNMPDHDLGDLSAELLAEHIEYAYRAKKEFAWAKDTPDEIFLNYVLPYANVNERRDAWRKEFYEKFRDTVEGCRTRGEVAVTLNTRIFDMVGVHYSKARPKADQSPSESIAAGKASCTGLSILLADACRAMGVPARVVGTPSWVESSGNHTWVEIWDNGWHALGASESKVLDQTWFNRKASTQIPGDARHAIYGASFKKTGVMFPMVWTRARYVHATDVTRRYAINAVKPISLDEISELLSVGDLAEVLEELSAADRRLTLKDVAKAKELIWQKYAGGITDSEVRQKEHKDKAVSYNGKTMRYDYKRVGERPADGYPLYIATHGGGGAPTRVNDSQWQHMQRYYLGGVKAGIYLAPRGVTDTWNLHWVNESFACYDRIIENMMIFENIDPNRVYFLGYSAGGDATYQVPARAADRWAGAAMSAGHPNGVPPDNYASLAFLIQVGEKDSAYQRNTVAAQYGVKLDRLQSAHPDYYRHAVYVHVGRGHGFMDHDSAGRPQKVYVDCGEWLEKKTAAVTTHVDCNSIHWLDRFTRDPAPEKVIWDCKTTTDRSGGKQPGFWPTAEKGRQQYWLGLDRYDKDVPLEAKRIVAEYSRSTNRIQVSEVGNFVRFYLCSDMLDLGKEVAVEVDGHTLVAQPMLSLRVLIRTLLDRGDPSYMFPACLTLSMNSEGTWMLE